MSSSSSSRTPQSDGEEVTIDTENSVNHNRFYDTRDQLCSANLLQNSVAYKIILDRGIMDGQHMRLSVPRALRLVDTSNTPEVMAMMNSMNAAIIADMARISSKIASNAINLAVLLSDLPTEVMFAGDGMIAWKMLVEIALTAVDSTIDIVNIVRSMSRNGRRSLCDGHGMNG